jgi:peptidoglycan/LPS O-acetylase OafA/YrhL
VPDADARVLRLQQGAVTVVLLAAFVFQLPLLIPIAAVLPGLDAALGASGPTARLWRAALAGRAGPAKNSDSAGAFRTQSLAVFSALVIATLVWLAGLDGLAMILGILVALLAALCATGLFSLGAELDRRKGGGSGSRPR